MGSPLRSVSVALLLASCSPAAGPPASPAPAGSSSASPAGSTGAAGAGAPGKALKVAADCPKTGEPVAEPGAPSKGKERHDEMVALFQKHRDKFRCCYDVARQQTPALKGAYSIEVVLKPDGSIKQAGPKKEASEINDGAMDACMVDVARSLKFSANAEGKETTIPYPFGFTPGGGK